MTVFTFNVGIPAANNNPSVDQPDMLSNNVASNAILAVDHVTYNTAGSGGSGASGGQHLQVTFNSLATPSAPVDPISIGYTNNSATMAQVTGSATTIAQEFFRNQNGVFPVSALRAFGVFTTTGTLGAIVPSNAFNISSINHPSLTQYVITLIANTTNANNVAVIVSMTTNNFTSYSFVGGVLTITVPSATAGPIISFFIYQV